MQKQNLNLIQMLRGVASLLVVLLHVTLTARETLGMDFLGGLFDFGGAGVDIFFVLSGFIITYTSKKLLNNPKNFLRFLRKRVIRIFPVYWIIITGFLIIQFVFPSYYRTHYDPYFLNLASTYLLLPDHPMVNGVSWTLSYELFFYFLFSMAFIITNRTLRITLSVIYCAVMVILPLSGHSAETGNSWFKLVFMPMNTEFFIGILAALAIPLLSRKVTVSFLVAGSVAFIAAGLFSDTGHIITTDAFNRVILFGIPSFFIITGIVKFEQERKTNVHGFLVLLGEASYSLYLVHLPLVTAAIKILKMKYSGTGFTVQVILMLTVIIVSLISIAFYRILEKPLINRLNKFFNN